LLGAGEGPALPAALHAAYRWFPDGRRALATAVIEAGVPLGSAAAAILVTRAIASAGWHAAFGILGVLSLVWSALWLALERPAPKSAYSQTDTDPRLPIVPPRAVLVNRTMAGVVVSGFAGYWVSAISVIWLPSYLHEGAGLSQAAAGTVLAVAWVVQVPLFALTGAFSSWLTSRGLSSELARVWPTTAGLAIGALTMIALAGSASPSLAIAFAALCIGSTVVAATLLPPIVAEIAPVAYRSTALGVVVALAALGGIVAPIVFGRAVDLNGGGALGYRAAFIIAGSFVLIAAIVGHVLMRPREDGARLRRLDAAFEQQALV
jgi:MFS family permease